jgi:hypothetical protein
LLCLGFAAAAVARAERTASAVFAVVSEKGLPEEGGEDWLRPAAAKFGPPEERRAPSGFPPFCRAFF